MTENARAMERQDLPTFTVVVPTYNRPRQLARCVAALAELDYPRDRFEVIVADDASPTPLEPVLLDVRDRASFRLLRQPRNAGPAAARNAGAAASASEMVAFTDDDCAVDPGWLRAYAAVLAKDPSRLCGGRTVNALTTNPYASASQLIQETAYAYFNADPDDASSFASSNLACSVAMFRSVGGFNVNFRASEDRELCDRWRRRGSRLSYVADAVVHHAHDLTLAKFYRQHFSYGQGAWHFHAARARHAPPAARRGPFGLNFRPDLSFYAQCLRNALSQRTARQSLAQAALMGVWQVANTAGFVHERRRARRGTDWTSPGEGQRPSAGVQLS